MGRSPSAVRSCSFYHFIRRNTGFPIFGFNFNYEGEAGILGMHLNMEGPGGYVGSVVGSPIDYHQDWHPLDSGYCTLGAHVNTWDGDQPSAWGIFGGTTMNIPGTEIGSPNYHWYPPLNGQGPFPVIGSSFADIQWLNATASGIWMNLGRPDKAFSNDGSLSLIHHWAHPGPYLDMGGSWAFGRDVGLLSSDWTYGADEKLAIVGSPN